MTQSELAEQLADLRRELADIARQRAVIDNDMLRLNRQLANANAIGTPQWESLIDRKMENVTALNSMQARSTAIKLEISNIADQEGGLFERNFMKVAKATLPTKTYARLIDQATALSGMTNKKKSKSRNA